jgi:hypothetical protein
VAVVALTVLGFAGTQVYAHTWRTVHQVKMVKRIFETPRPKVERPSIRTAQRAPARAPRAPRGLQPGSLLREPALRRALGDLRRAAPDGSRLSMLRVAADRIDAEAVAGSRVVRLRRSWNGPATVVSRQTGAAATPALIAFDRVDARAPGRIAAAAARLGGASGSAALQQAVLLDAAGLRWTGLLAGGRQVVAAPDGRGLRALA